MNDTDAAFELVAEFDPTRSAAVAIIKHANPCGVAEGATLAEAYERAFACDPVSAFGGVVAVNRRLDAEAARRIVEVFTEVIIAPDADDEALAIVGARRNLRLLLAGAVPDPRAPGLAVRSVAGGFLVQDRDNAVVEDLALNVVTKRAPSDREFADLRFAWRVAKHVKSNAIVYARDGATVGIGAGQMSRVDSSRAGGAQGRGRGARGGIGDVADAGKRRRVGRVFPFRRWPARRGRGGRGGDHSARRIGARRGSDRRRRRSGPRDGLHRVAPFQTLRAARRRGGGLSVDPPAETLARLRASGKELAF